MELPEVMCVWSLAGSLVVSGSLALCRTGAAGSLATDSLARDSLVTATATATATAMGVAKLVDRRLGDQRQQGIASLLAGGGGHGKRSCEASYPSRGCAGHS